MNFGKADENDAGGLNRSAPKFYRSIYNGYSLKTESL
jgi:hypothetical protein